MRVARSECWGRRRDVVLFSRPASRQSSTAAPRSAQAPPRQARFSPGPYVRNGYQHDSITHAPAPRFHSNGSAASRAPTTPGSAHVPRKSITEASHHVQDGHGASPPCEQFQARTLEFSRSRSSSSACAEIEYLDRRAARRYYLLSFVRDDGKGFVARIRRDRVFLVAEFGEMIGAGSTSIRGRSDGR
jgi:hypothetical protein